MHNIQDYSVLYNNSVRRTIKYVNFDLLLTRGKYLHDRVSSRSVEVWANKTSLIPPLFNCISCDVSI